MKETERAEKEIKKKRDMKAMLIMMMMMMMMTLMNRWKYTLDNEDYVVLVLFGW